MNHKNIEALLIALICMVIIALCILMATPASAYACDRITTAKQDALHQAADMLRWEGYSDASPEIRALSAAWWEEEEALNILAKVVRYEADPQWCE